MQITKSLLPSALIGGLCLASFHLCWVILVWLGFAQSLLDYIFKLHMLNTPFIVQPFNFLLASKLIAITFIIGAFYGVIFSIIKSLFYKQSM